MLLLMLLVVLSVVSFYELIYRQEAWRFGSRPSRLQFSAGVSNWVGSVNEVQSHAS